VRPKCECVENWGRFSTAANEWQWLTYFGLARRDTAGHAVSPRISRARMARAVTCGPETTRIGKGVPAVEITEVRIKLMEDNSGSNERSRHLFDHV